MYENLHPYSLIPDLFPKTFHSVKVLADQRSGDLKTFSGTTLDLCSKDHHVFTGPREAPKRRRAEGNADVAEAEVKIETECPTCQEPRSNERQLLVMDMVSRIQAMWTHEPTRQLFM